MSAQLEPIVGRYVTFDISGEACRVYFEEAGSGIPLVCLHTAGADSRQFRHLMCDPAVTQHYRVIAFDMPWHQDGEQIGKALPQDVMRRKNGLVLAGMCLRREQDGSPSDLQLEVIENTRIGRERRRIRLETAADAHIVAAKVREAGGILIVLRKTNGKR